MRIQRNRCVAYIRKGIIYSHHLFDYNPNTDIWLESGFGFLIDVNFLLKIAKTSSQIDNIVIPKLNAYMRIDRNWITLNQNVSHTIEGHIQIHIN